jgi:hypothetical protein
LKLLVLGALCLQTACVPLAHHGPWVRDGLSGDLLTGAALLRDEAGSDVDFALGVDAALRYGIVPGDSSWPAVAFGLQVPVLPFLVSAGQVDASALELVTGDVYVSALQTSGLTTSIGFSGSLYHKVPYVQVGSRAIDDGSWYTTQAFLISDNDFQMWLPSFTWVDRSEDKPRTSAVTLGAGIGNENGDGRYMFMLGITLEFHRRDARVR